jgi:hypothetical protein
MSCTALPTDGRFRFVASDRTGRPWITLIALRGVHASGTGSLTPLLAARAVTTAIEGSGIGRPTAPSSRQALAQIWIWPGGISSCSGGLRCRATDLELVSLSRQTR